MVSGAQQGHPFRAGLGLCEVPSRPTFLRFKNGARYYQKTAFGSILKGPSGHGCLKTRMTGTEFSPRSLFLPPPQLFLLNWTIRHKYLSCFPGVIFPMNAVFTKNFISDGPEAAFFSSFFVGGKNGLINLLLVHSTWCSRWAPLKQLNKTLASLYCGPVKSI